MSTIASVYTSNLDCKKTHFTKEFGILGRKRCTSCAQSGEPLKLRSDSISGQHFAFVVWRKLLKIAYEVSSYVSARRSVGMWNRGENRNEKKCKLCLSMLVRETEHSLEVRKDGNERWGNGTG